MVSEKFQLLAFIASYSFCIGSIIIFWVAIRDFLVCKSYRAPFFGIGFFLVSLGNLMIYLTDINVNVMLALVPTTIGFVMLWISLVRQKWQYLFGLVILIPLLIPTTSPWFVLSAMLVLIFSYLSYKNFCLVFCNKVKCERKGIENKEWTFVFIFLSISLATHIIEVTSALAMFLIVVRVINLFSLIMIIGLIYYHIFKCMNFSKKEKLLFPLMIGFIVIFSVTGFWMTGMTADFAENKLESSVRESAKSIKYIADISYPDGELQRKLKEKSPDLSYLSDKILAETDLRSTFFLGNERVGASPSITGKGRFIGTNIEDPTVKETVLVKGEVFSGRVEKSGQILVAAYVPIYDGTQVIGMVSSAQSVDDLQSFQKNILYQITAGVAFFFLMSVGTILYVLPRINKS